MAAHDHLNAEQLRMFIPAKELVGYNPNPFDYEGEAEYHQQGASDWSSSADPREGFGMTQFWDQKYDEAEERGLHESIGEEGVRKPVNIFHGGATTAYGYAVMKYADPKKPILAHGHHRVVSAAEHDPEMLLPVRHYGKDFGHAVDDQQYRGGY